MSRPLSWLLCSLLVALWSSVAGASAIFPVEIAKTLSLSYLPACTLCHATDEGESGTVVQPFGRKMMGYGLMKSDTAMLVALLNQMRDAAEDTDKDGVSDIEEIKKNTNPSINDITGKLAEDYPPPVYGCQASSTRGRIVAADRGWSIAVLLLLAVMWMRGRAPRRGLEISALILAAASLAACHEAPLDVVEGVDLGRFQGRWYEIARLPRATQVHCAGTTAFYKMTSDRDLVVTNECSVGGLNGVRRQVTASAKVTNAAVPAKLSVDFGGFYGDYWIIDLDRVDYGYAVVGHPTRQYLWILSRRSTLEASTLAPIVERANQKGFDTSRLEYTKQAP